MAVWVVCAAYAEDVKLRNSNDFLDSIGYPADMVY
jgi:hypothetical protein